MPPPSVPAAPPAAPSSRRARLLGAGLGLVVGVGLALFVAGEDLASLDQALPGKRQPDGFGAVYLHHAVHEALLDGRLTLRDPDQFIPFGFETAAANGGNILEMLLSGLFRLVLPWPAWLSAAALAWIPLNLLAALPLGYRLWGRTAPAVAAAAAWALYPPVLLQIGTLRLTQAALVGLPLAVAGLLAVAERGGRRAVILAGVGMALTGLGYWFNGMFMVLLAPLFVLWGLRHRPARDLLRDLAAAAGLCLALIAPAVAVVIVSTVRAGGYAGSPISSEWASPVFPDSLQLVGAQPESLQGWAPVVLVAGTALALVVGRRRPLWVGLAGLGFLFAMGPGQRIGETLYLLPWYPLWKWVPGVDRMSHPDRWALVAGLFLVILAVEGLSRLAVRLPGRAGGVALAVLPWLAPAGVAAELRQREILPLGHWDARPPAVWRDLAAREGGGIVVMPVLNAGSITCAWQPFHGRPTVGGMVEGERALVPRGFLDWIDESELLLGLYALSSGEDVEVPVHTVEVEALAAAGVDTVVLDREAWQGHAHLARVPVEARLTEAFGAPVFADGSGAIWILPERGAPGEPPESGRSAAVLPDVPPDGGDRQGPPPQGPPPQGPPPQGPPPQGPPPQGPSPQGPSPQGAP